MRLKEIRKHFSEKSIEAARLWLAKYKEKRERDLLSEAQQKVTKKVKKEKKGK